MQKETHAERNWTDSETRALLCIRANEQISAQITGTVRDYLVYGEITRLLRARGLQRSQRQVTTKLKTLKRKYLNVHEHHRNNSHGGVLYWSYYDLCKSIWGTRRPVNTRANAKAKLEEPQSTCLEKRRSTDIEVSISNDDEETDVIPKVTQPPRNKAKKDHSKFIRDEDALHIQDERQYEERLHREARAEQKEERANLMVMWKEMMEFQGNLLKEFLHHSSLPTSLPYQKHAHYNQASSSLPGTSTSYMAPYEPTGIETENESVISQEEEEKYTPSENITILDVRTVNCTNDSQSNITPALSPPSTQATEKTDLETSVLRRQERVLQLQEEYYSLKIKYLKDKMTRDQVTEQ